MPVLLAQGLSAFAQKQCREYGMGRFFSSAMVASMRTGFLLPGEAHAVDLSEAWAAHADEFSQVFIRKGWPNQIGFRALSEQHGGGFIVEADRLRGKFASCKIKSRKEYGQTLNIGLRDRYHALERPAERARGRPEQAHTNLSGRFRHGNGLRALRAEMISPAGSGGPSRHPKGSSRRPNVCFSVCRISAKSNADARSMARAAIALPCDPMSWREK